MTSEEMCIETAVYVVHAAGGRITFEQYDADMKGKKYWTPFYWIAGWGGPIGIRKANNDKMCAFAACRVGRLVQTDTGYEENT